MAWGIEETWREATVLAAEMCGVSAEAVRGEAGRMGRRWLSHRAPQAALRLAIYLTVATAEASQRQIGRALGLGNVTVSHHENAVARRIDEDDAFDDAVSELLELLNARLGLAARQAEMAERWRAAA